MDTRGFSPFGRMYFQALEPRPAGIAPPITDALVRQQVANLAPDIRNAIDGQLREMNSILTHVQTLLPGEPEIIIALLKKASGIIDSLVVQTGGIAGWVLGSRMLLFKHAQRLLPKQRSDFTHPPAWTEHPS